MLHKMVPHLQVAMVMSEAVEVGVSQIMEDLYLITILINR
jgi:hypothetical protein